MIADKRVVLAHEPDFRLGPITVRPATRELVCGDLRDVLEPRVMQVLVALARANGAVLTRDELTQTCWEGRVVGEDAINRVISRLRRCAERIGGGFFQIETLTRVGYRLVRGEDDVPCSSEAASAAPAPVMPADPRRRRLLAGTAALAATGVAGGLWWMRADPATPVPTVPASVAALLQQAHAAAGQMDTQSQAQAIGLMRKVVAIEPGFADGWGRLAVIYAVSAGTRQAEASAMQVRARGALARARALDPGNSYAFVAEAMLLPRLGHWLEAEQLFRRALANAPDNTLAKRLYAMLLLGVGRIVEAEALTAAVVAGEAPAPGLLYFHAQLLWAANRQDEADRAIEQAFELYPMHFAVWFTRFYILLYSGRPDQALAQAQNVSGRPPGIPAADFLLTETAARAFITRAPADIDAAVRTALDFAGRGAGHAENAMQYTAALGRRDAAFLVAGGYYLGRGFAVAEQRFSPEQAVFTRLPDRRTWPLFVPSTAQMRADRRFRDLTGAVGLDRYWHEAKVGPDYLRS